MQRRYREKRNDQEHNEKLRFFHLAKFWMDFFCFVSEKILSSIPMLLVMLIAQVGKRSNSRSWMFSKAGVLKNFAIFTGTNLCWSLFSIHFKYWRPAFLFKKRLQCSCIEDLFITSFQNFYLMIDNNWYFRVIVYYCKIRHVTERTLQ